MSKAVIGNRMLEIVPSEDNENPWDAECRLFDVYHWHRRYGFCDDATRVSHPDEVEATEDEVVRFPLYIYDHGSVAYSLTPFGDKWDSGQCGILVITKSRLEAMGCAGWDEERLRRDTAGWVESFSQWANGDCWGFELSLDDNVIDSCYGFYGSDPDKNGMMDYIGEENRDLVNALK